MKKISLLFVSIILIFSFCNTTEDNDDTNKTLETELDSVSYSLGTFNAIELQKQGLNKINGNSKQFSGTWSTDS